jgi:hypothetical protein
MTAKLVNFPISDGMVPLKQFPVIDKYVSEIMFPMVLGIYPFRLLLEINKL